MDYTKIDRADGKYRWKACAEYTFVQNYLT